MSMSWSARSCVCTRTMAGRFLLPSLVMAFAVG
jgi:hypothetical protein